MGSFGDEAADRGARITEMEGAHRRLEHLYEISKLLTRFEDVERSAPKVMALVAQTIALHNAVLIVDKTGGAGVTVWQAAGESAERLQAALAHAQTTYGYLVRSGAVLERQAGSATGVRKNFIHLPLAVSRGPIFGALQLEGVEPLDERDLNFANAVVNQLAVAIDRQAVIDARQAATEVAEREQRLIAQVGAIVTSSLDRRTTIGAVVRSVVPVLADLCVIDEVGEDGAIQRLEVVFADEKKQRALSDRVKLYFPRPGWNTPQAKVLESGQPLLFPEIADPAAEGIAQDEEHASAMRAAGAKSMMVLPLRARGKKLGVLTFVVGDSGRRYSMRDLALGQEIAHRAAIGIDNAWLYEQAQRASRARDDLLAIVAHDLRNPLAAVMMGLDTLLNRPEVEDRRKSLRKDLHRIRRGAKGMNRLINDLLDTVSIERGQFGVAAGIIEIGPAISEALETLRPLAATKSLGLESELSADLPPVCADASRFQQVLANLLGNAIKFTPEGGTITVRAQASGDVVTFSVADSGVGMPVSDIPMVFDRFWQARRGLTLGAGLGLFIVKGIVDAHGGKTWVESKVGEGTTFFFTLPVAPSRADRPDDEPVMDSRARAGAIDRRHNELQPDAPRDRDAIAKLVEELGFRRQELHDALESTRVARELAERAGEFKRDFVGVVSHELRGPLTALELLIERVQRDKDSPPTARQQPIIRRMSAVVARLSTMIESLLQHALIQSGRLAAQIEIFSPAAIATEVLEDLRPYAEERGLELGFDAVPDLPPLRSDPDLVRLILLNLVTNAIKFTEHGSVRISIAEDHGVHRIIVRDSGPGISAADRLRIFEPFTGVGDAKQKHIPGMGLGLTLVREVVSALGGGVELESEVGRGSTFTTTLPSMGETSLDRGAPLH